MLIDVHAGGGELNRADAVIGKGRQRAVAVDGRDRDHVGVLRRVRGRREEGGVIVRAVVAGGGDDDHAVLVGVLDRGCDRGIGPAPHPNWR